MLRKIVLSLIVVLSCNLLGMAQNRQISGTVFDVNGAPIIGATVMVDGTQLGTTTGVDGDFSLSAPSEGAITVSYIGYESQTQAVAGKTNFKFSLAEDSQQLEQVMVVAFGKKRKQDLVGSVSAVDGSIIKNSQAASVSSALEGAVAGVQIVSESGQPGDDSSIVIRGVGSMSASNEALVVVDGTPFNGKLSDINPADIESIVVSKDAVSNSLYGSRAAGGVVMVTTKKGNKDKVNINFQGTWGVSSRAYNDYNMVTNPGEFYEMMWYGIRNTNWASGKTLDESAALATSTLLGEVGNYNAFIIPEGEDLVGLDGKLNSNAKLRYNDTFADALFNTSLRQEYVASASGGNDKNDYYVSMGYLDNDSYVLGSSYERLTTRVNVNSQLNPWLKVGTNVSYSKATQNGVQERNGTASNPFAVARDWAPIFPVHAYDAEGNMKYDAHGKPMYDAGNGETDGTKNRPTATNQNVIASMSEDIRETIYNNVTSRTYAQVNFLKHFTFTANYSHDFTNAYNTTYYTPLIGDGQSFNGRGTKTMNNVVTTNFNQILAFENTVNDIHSISAKAGHEYYNYTEDYFDGQKTNFYDPENPELVNGGEMQYMDSYQLNHNIEGYFAMADYSYDHKYYLSAAFRRDGTSRFLNRWGNFWSVGGAWRISSEQFMQNASWVDDLKLRASYGTQGNENLLLSSSDYKYIYTPYQDQYDVSWNGSALATNIAFFGNPDLTWEKQNTFDLGLDYRIFNRVYGSVEFFNRTTDDMLFRRTLPFSTAGREYNWENLGAMKNSGVEFEVNVDIIKNKDFSWTASLIGAHYRNEIVTLPEDNREEGITSGNFKLMEGKSRYEYFTNKYAGMDENGNPLWYMDEKDENGNLTGNQITTGKYADATKYYLDKSALPDLTGGFNTTLKYKGFDLSIATSFQLGGWAYDYEYLSGLSSSFYVGKNKDMWNTFNPETGEGSLPIWNANNSSNSFTQRSDLNLISASYFNIRNITLGYTLPKSWMQKIGVDGIRVFVNADNVALFSKRQGFDPRVAMSGQNDNYGGYSPMKVVSGGLNVTF